MNTTTAGRKAVTLTTPTDRDVVLTRRFDAPRALVFDALTRAELLTRWYAMPGWTLEVCELDARVGGHWRYVLRKPDGKRVGQFGEIRELVRPSRIVQTEAWEDWDAGESLVTTELVADGDGTLLTSTIRFPSREVRDTVVKSGLSSGIDAHYQRLDDLLAKAPQPA